MSKFSAANWASEAILSAGNNNVQFKQVTAALNHDGLLEVFFLDTLNNINRTWQIAQNGGWGTGLSLSPTSAKQITVAANDDGHLETFYVGTDSHSQIYHNWETEPASSNNPLPAWSGQKAMSSDSAKQISAVLTGAAKMQIFYVGTNNKLYYNIQTGPDGGEGNNYWVGEKLLSKTQILEVIPITSFQGLPTVFYRGLDNALYYNVFLASGTWGGETRFGPYYAVQMAAVLNSQKLIEIFYVGTNNLLYFNRQTSANDSGAWLGETSLRGVQAKQVAAAMDSNGVLEVFFTDLNDKLFHTWETATDTWAAPVNFQTNAAVQMTVVPNQDGHLELIYIGTNGNLLHNWQVPV